MEHLLHYVWKHKLFQLQPLLTADGQTVEVIDPGLANTNAGPDFFNAKIKIDGMLWVGNIEIHLHASDWWRHHHHRDKAYDSVILHVVSDIDARPGRTDGSLIPQMELHCPPRILQHYQDLLTSAHYPPCHQLIPEIPAITIHSWLSRLQTERLEQKTTQIRKYLNASCNNWEQAFFITLARNFGFGINSDAFELWARNIPLEAVNKHRDSLFQIEAVFFGQAGLLADPPEDSYHRKLAQEYVYLKQKFGFHYCEDVRWKLLRTRPGNFPHLRIAQLACLYHRSQGLLSELLESEQPDRIRALLRGGTSEYWLTHYTFRTASPQQPKTLSNTSIDLIIINTVVPFLYAYGKHKSDDRKTARAIFLLENMKPENNFITRMWSQCGLKAEHAGDSQALIQLKKEYCDLKKCLQCRIGYEYLKSK